MLAADPRSYICGIYAGAAEGEETNHKHAVFTHTSIERLMHWPCTCALKCTCAHVTCT